MLLKRVDDVRAIVKLKRRMDVAEGDIKQIKCGMHYLVKQLTVPDTPRRKIGFDAKPGEASNTPYSRVNHEFQSSTTKTQGGLPDVDDSGGPSGPSKPAG